MILIDLKIGTGTVQDEEAYSGPQIISDTYAVEGEAPPFNMEDNQNLDYSRYFLSCHSEQTSNDTKDEQKYDIVLANINGRLFGKFKPKNPISLTVTNRRQKCGSYTDEVIKIFDGEIQHVTCDEVLCKISGSCSQGGMTSGIKETYVPPVSTTIKKTVIHFLIEFGIHYDENDIEPVNNKFGTHQPQFKQEDDFDVVFQRLADEAQSIWFFDEQNRFHFVSPSKFFSLRNVTGYVMEGQTASTMIGLCTIVNVNGGSSVTPDDDFSVTKLHSRVSYQAKAPQDILKDYGELYAPPVIRPNCDYQTCKNLAENLLQWYLQFKDVPSVKLSGKAPFLRTKIMYMPFNGRMPPSKCGGIPEDIEMGPIVGIVTRRVVDISAENGFTSTLDLTTTWEDDSGPKPIYIPVDEKGNLKPEVEVLFGDNVVVA